MMRDMKIGTKLLLSSLLLIALLGGVILFLLWQTHRLSDLEHTVSERAAAAHAVLAISHRFTEVYTLAAEAVINRELDAGRTALAAARESAGRDLAELDRLVDTADEKRLAGSFAQTYTQYLDLIANKLFPLLESSADGADGMAAVRAVDEEIDGLRESGDAVLESLDKSLRDEATSAEATFDAATARMALIAEILALVGVLAALVVAYVTGRGIARPLREVVTAIQGIGSGDLRQRVKIGERGDELGILAKEINAFADNLEHEVLEAFERLAAGDLTFVANGVIREPLAKTNAALNEVMLQIQTAGEQIASGSSEVSDASQSLSQGATESAASLEEIGSSMNEMGAQTRQNAENATLANKLSSQARQAAEEGNARMIEMIEAMGDINSSSRNISKIIKTIDEIAFQTNLLALNAAVEAARAGQHGKGFAVVAEEVRNLAARSAKAAQETADLIEGSVNKVAAGSQIADKTAEALGDIVTGVGKVTDLVAEIAASSNEQAQGIAEINSALGQIDQVTQQNTANAEESAAAAEELSSQSEQLRTMLRRFKLAGQTGTAPTLKRPPVKTPTGHLPAPKPPRPAQNRPAETQGWDNFDQEVPRQVIALDDSEFGKY